MIVLCNSWKCKCGCLTKQLHRKKFIFKSKHYKVKNNEFEFEYDKKINKIIDDNKQMIFPKKVKYDKITNRIVAAIDDKQIIFAKKVKYDEITKRIVVDDNIDDNIIDNSIDDNIDDNIDNNIDNCDEVINKKTQTPMIMTNLLIDLRDFVLPKTNLSI